MYLEKFSEHILIYTPWPTGIRNSSLIRYGNFCFKGGGDIDSFHCIHVIFIFGQLTKNEYIDQVPRKNILNICIPSGIGKLSEYI